MLVVTTMPWRIHNAGDIDDARGEIIMQGELSVLE